MALEIVKAINSNDRNVEETAFRSIYYTVKFVQIDYEKRPRISVCFEILICIFIIQYDAFIFCPFTSSNVKWTAQKE